MRRKLLCSSRFAEIAKGMDMYQVCAGGMLKNLRVFDGVIVTENTFPIPRSARLGLTRVKWPGLHSRAPTLMYVK